MSISRLIPIDLREIWKHEALDFTSWLAENLDYLEEVTGLTLSLIEQEAQAGDFRVDILAEEGSTGALVIIENQLEKTDHAHLGKLITYMSNFDAKTAIWIAREPRPEHERAIQWLNEFLPADTSFYLIQIEAYRIADSPPAPKFTLVAGPSEESRQIGRERKELAERHRLRLEFWKKLLEKLNEKNVSLHANIRPSKEHWISTGAGKSGLTYAYVILKNTARIELYIDTADTERNKEIFDFLYQHREKIEEAFGAPLEWQRLENKRASRIAYYITGLGGIHDREQWDALQEAMINAMIRLEKALKPYIRRLP